MSEFAAAIKTKGDSLLVLETEPLLIYAMTVSLLGAQGFGGVLDEFGL
jgi:hypothetical protein